MSKTKNEFLADIVESNHAYSISPDKVEILIEIITDLNKQLADSTPLGGRRVKDTSQCRCVATNILNNCGCGFGQCAQGLIY